MSWLSKALGIKGKEDIGSTENNDLGRGSKCWRSQNDKNGAAEEFKEAQCSCSLDNQRGQQRYEYWNINDLDHPKSTYEC